MFRGDPLQKANELLVFGIGQVAHCLLYTEQLVRIDSVKKVDSFGSQTNVNDPTILGVSVSRYKPELLKVIQHGSRASACFQDVLRNIALG